MSGELLASIAGLAALDALNPATIGGVALILLLPGRRQLPTAALFVLGAYLTVLVGGVAVFLLADTVAASITGGLVWVRRIAFTLAALAVLVAAVRRLRAYRRRALALPSWLNARTALPLGVLVTGVDLPNAFPYVIAIERLATADVQVAPALLVLAAYALVYCLPCLILLAAGSAWGGAVRRRLDRIYVPFGAERDMPRNLPAAAGLAVLAAVLGAVAATA